MRYAKFPIILVALFCFGIAGLVTASEFDQSYLTAAAKHFEVEAGQVDVIIKQGVDIEDVPVILLIATRTKSSINQIAKVRARGDSWQEIITGRSISTEIFYIMIAGEITSKVYAPIFAKLSTSALGGIDKVALSDDEVVNMTNLRFISSFHDYSIFEVMAMRDFGKDFPRINNLVDQRKAEMNRLEKQKKKEASLKAKKAEGSGDND